jgi:hypothetical protein
VASWHIGGHRRVINISGKLAARMKMAAKMAALGMALESDGEIMAAAAKIEDGNGYGGGKRRRRALRGGDVTSKTAAYREETKRRNGAQAMAAWWRRREAW